MQKPYFPATTHPKKDNCNETGSPGGNHGNPENPTLLPLHGLPTSSHMFRNRIPEPAAEYRAIARDDLGFGASGMPDAAGYDDGFATTTDIISRLIDGKAADISAVLLMDHGASVRFRVFAENLARVTEFNIQNGDAHEAGLREFPMMDAAVW